MESNRSSRIYREAIQRVLRRRALLRGGGSRKRARHSEGSSDTSASDVPITASASSGGSSVAGIPAAVAPSKVPVDKGKGIAPGPSAPSKEPVSGFEMAEARNLLSSVLREEDRGIVTSLNLPEMVGDGLTCIMRLTHYLFHMERLCSGITTQAKSMGEEELSRKEAKILTLEGMLRQAMEEVAVQRQMADDFKTESERMAKETATNLSLTATLQSKTQAVEAKVADTIHLLERERARSARFQDALHALRAELSGADRRVSEAVRAAGNRAVADFRGSPAYRRELSEAATDSFIMGFESCLTKVSRKHPGIDLSDILPVD